MLITSCPKIFIGLIFIALWAYENTSSPKLSQFYGIADYSVNNTPFKTCLRSEEKSVHTCNAQHLVMRFQPLSLQLSMAEAMANESSTAKEIVHFQNFA